MYRGVWGEKLPDRFVRFAYGQPGVLDRIGPAVYPPYLLRLECQRIGRDQDVRVRPVFRFHFAAHVFEAALPGFYVELTRVRRQVLRVHIQLDMAAHRSLVSFRVVLHVVGAQPIVPVKNFDITVGKKEVAFLALLLGFQTYGRVAGRQARAFRRNLCHDAGRQDTAREQDANGPYAKRADEFAEGNHILAGSTPRSDRGVQRTARAHA